MDLVPNKHLLLNVPIQSTKKRKKEMCVDNNVRETIGDVYCPTFRNQKCVYISTNKTTSFYDCRKCKACCHVLNILFRDQNRQLCCLAATVHIVLQIRLVATSSKAISIFEKVSPPIIFERIGTRTKKAKMSPNME